MALRRVFVDAFEADAALARGGQAHHLARVVRLRPGERVAVSDQRRAYAAVAEACSPEEVRFRLEERLPDPEPQPRIAAGLAIIRFPRFEWAVEKLTELGVRTIRPVAAERSDARLVAAAAKKLLRWRRIAQAAAQQARLLRAPEIEEPCAFASFLRTPRQGTGLLADLGSQPLAEVYRGGPATLLVGPEGGWTDDERESARREGFAAAALGHSVLRTETAAVALAALCVGRLSEEAAR